MKRTAPAPDAEAYVAALEGWQRGVVASLRRAVLAAADSEAGIKWGHLVYHHRGPALLIRAEAGRVRFGFWRGQRLRDLEPRLEPGGRYEMATLELTEATRLAPAVARPLAREAARLNERHGDPTRAAGPKR